MKFGKEFTTHLEETLPDWRDKYLSYKPLKKLLKKNIPSSEATADSSPRNPPPPSAAADPALPELQDWFVRILNEELEKVNDFYVDKEEEFIIRLQELKQRIEQLKNERSTEAYLSYDIEYSEEMMDIRKDFVSIHGEMVLLKNYSSLNFAGLVKILKKYDKRTGEVLRLNFTQLALQEPFFTTEPLTRLVRECEQNLELLFPLEAEVLQSAVAPQGRAGESAVAPQGRAGESSSSHMTSETTLSLGEDNVDIYRSTLSAMRTIQGLRRASSTYSPLSFSAVFANRGNESGGDITEENSADSLVSPNNAEEIDNEPACSSK